MLHAILHQVHDPPVAALSVFAVLIAIEAVDYVVESDKPPRAAVTARPTHARAS